MHDSALSQLDRGLSYGDGFFTTMLVENGAIQLWPYHHQRLLKAQQQLGFPLVELEQIKQELEQALQGKVLAVAKITITRGVGGRGYSLPQDAIPTIFTSISEFPAHYLNLRQQGLTLGLAKQRLASGNITANLKTLNRLEQVLLKQEADIQHVDDLVCCDIFDHVIEGVASNLFWVKENCIYTSDLQGAGVAGTQRAFLLDNLGQSPYQLKIGKFTLAHMKQADEIFVSNALLQFAPIKQFAEYSYTAFPVCRWFQDLVKHAS
ncbi:aminodeoxychorismate lyase [Agarivorans sp.]|uniref:aminodeoxychorismate lyase n=1 Tax=Agarivorans sp. TaxID=1872412 RepID=UPI003CFE20B8